MLRDAPPESPALEIAKAVAISTLTAVLTGLVEWGIDELRAKFGSKREGKK